MHQDHPIHGPQLDPTDGTIGELQLVKRYVLVAGKNAEIWTANQGRCTRATEKEAQEWLTQIKTNNNAHLVPEDLRVGQRWCYPGHFDPASPVH